MPEMRIRDLADIVNGRLDNTTADWTVSDYHFDSRLLGDENSLFFALQAEKNDGHNYVNRLATNRGNAAVVRRDFDPRSTEIPLIRVDDPLKAAQDIARHFRKKLQHVKFIGVTGSVGKTTTKEFIHQILSSKYRCYKSPGNWNNWIGLPFALMKMRGDEEVAVFELAMSDPGLGEIDTLAEIIRPDIALILNACPTHLEFLKTVENVALAKSEILNYLNSDDVAYISGDSKELLKACGPKRGHKIHFGRDIQTNQIALNEIRKVNSHSEIEFDSFGVKSIFSLPFSNRIHIENLFAAILICQQVGMKHFEIQKNLASIQPVQGRGIIRKVNDITIIDESYNSNPVALKKVLTWIDREFEQGKIAVVGDMLELGKDESEYHRETGLYFATLSYERLVTVGERAKHIAGGAREAGYASEQISSFSTAAEAGEFLKQVGRPGQAILFKASRGIGIERAIKEFLNE